MVDEVAKVEVDKVADMVVTITVKDFTDLHFTLAMQMMLDVMLKWMEMNKY